ncbi:carbon-nitrogen hydrolase family protein [Actinopolymorpha alba]|uniref:carbon-nitrogen hydrolase family protein n=1 Tax=Actinopolymorpha alba TaxID=533267 RepID=UPI000368C738|nr:nitrilase-related carbon-nitrogen hydrolase [Actinopolymorpha alba]
MRVAALQYHPTESREDNLKRVGAKLDEAAAAGVKVVLLPELFAVPFVQGVPGDPEFFSYAEPLDGPSNALVAAKSREHGITIVSSLFEATATPGVYHNTACTFVNGVLTSTYRKSHLPFSNAFPEKFYFRAGEEPPSAVDTGETKIGTIICYERHFPEMARRVALEGASLLCVPIASATAYSRSIFEIELRAHAVFNCMYVMSANRIGSEGPKEYFGGSAIYGPDGEVLAVSTDSGDDELVQADIDPGLLARKRAMERPFLRDRRPELYR